MLVFFLQRKTIKHQVHSNRNLVTAVYIRPRKNGSGSKFYTGKWYREVRKRKIVTFCINFMILCPGDHDRTPNAKRHLCSLLFFDVSYLHLQSSFLSLFCLCLSFSFLDVTVLFFMKTDIYGPY